MAAEDTYETHPACAAFPLLDDERLAQLADDIKERGQIEPITLVDGKVVDGRNRLRACRMLEIEPKVREVGGNPWALAWSLNGQRRDLSTGQRHAIWKECAAGSKEWEAERQRIQDEANRARAEKAKAGEVGRAAGKKKSDDEFSGPTTCGTTKKPTSKKNKSAEAEAAAAGVDRGTVEKNNWLEKHHHDLYLKVASGELTTSKAHSQAKKREKEAELAALRERETQPPDGKYDVIVIDPPWPMEKIARDVRPNQVSIDYPTMSEEEICALDIPAADSCHLWCWTTHKFLPMALRCLEVWGFRYVCTFVWHKPGGFQPVGLPQYNCEFALYARRGSPQFTTTKAFNTAFSAPRGAHSEKPEQFYDVLRQVTAGRRLDMFNRREIDGFDGWGNESGERLAG